MTRWFAIALLTTVPALVAGADTAHELNTRGVEHYDHQRWPEAIRDFQSALDAEPTNATIRKNLANAHQAFANDLAGEGDYQTALRELEYAIQLSPSDASPLVQAGAYYLHEGQVRDAIFRLEEAIELSPGDPDAHFLLGEAYYRDNDVKSALEQWKWVHEIAPDTPGLAERFASARRDSQVESDFRGRSSVHFNVTYDREAEGRLVHDILQILERAYRDVGTALRSYPETPIQVTLYTSEGFAHSTQLDEHVGAVYDGTKIRCPVIDASGKELPLEEIRRRLYHEYVHVAVRHRAKRQVPWWVNEGLAEALTRELSAEEVHVLRRAYDREAWFALGELEQSQLSRLNVEELYLAYKQSHATVAYLKDRYGSRRFGPMLEALAEGDDVETTLRRHFRHNFRTLELAVAAYVRDR